MSRFLLVLLSLWAFSSCHPPQNHSPAEIPPSDSVDKKKFFPVENMLRSEIAEVDSTPYRIMLYHVQNGKKDSVLLRQGDFDAAAKTFLVPGLDSASFASRFTESSFMDQTTGLLTFIYAAKDSLFGLRRVDLLMEPSLGNDKIHSFYLEVSSRDNDSLKVKKMTWIAGKHFSILELVHPAKGTTIARETRAVWND